MSVQGMGYFCVGTSKLDDWTSLAIGQLGLQAVDRGGPMRAFRMDDRKQRLIVDGGLMDGERFFGWEVADATALDTLAARLEKAGVAVRREIAVVADQRCAAEVISFRDPAGNRVEAFHGGQIADEPFRPARHIGGFRTGTQGLGHAVLIMPEIDAASHSIGTCWASGSLTSWGRRCRCISCTSTLATIASPSPKGHATACTI